MSDIKSALHAALFRPPVAAVLNQTLKEWDDEGEKHFPINNPSVPVQTNQPKEKNVPRNNVTTVTFETIKNNPGITAKEMSNILFSKGYKHSSVQATASCLVIDGQVRRVGSKLYALNDAYTPIKTTPAEKAAAKLYKLKKKVEQLKQDAKSRGIADLPVSKAKPQVEPKPAPKIETKSEGIAALAAPVAQATQEPPKPKRFAMLTTPQTPEQIVKGMTAYQARELYEHLKQLFGG
jgi:hypothetical protein